MDKKNSSLTLTSQLSEKARMIEEILKRPDMKISSWEEIMGGGVLVVIHIGRSTGREPLSYKDLGLHQAINRELTETEKKAKSAMEEIFDLGSKSLLPKDLRKTFDQHDDNIRNLPKQLGIRTALGYFVPCTCFAPVEGSTESEEEKQAKYFVPKFEAMKKKYFAERDKMLADYEGLKVRVEHDYIEAARTAYNVFNKLNPDTMSENQRLERAKFLLEARKRIRNRFPKKEVMRDSFHCEADYHFIDLKLLTGDSVLEQENKLQGVSTLELNELQWKQQELRERKALMDAMNREVMAQARRTKQEKIDNFLTEVISQVRGLVYEAVAGALTALQKNDSLGARSVFQLNNVINAVKRLEFYGDDDVEKAREQIEQLLAGYSGKVKAQRTVSIAQIENTLRRIAVVMRSTLIPLQYEFNEEREGTLGLIQVPVTPSQREEREAREGLNMRIPERLLERSERSEETFDTAPELVSSSRQERDSW